MKQKKADPDKIRLKQSQGVWRRFIKIFPKCDLPWVWVISYIILSLALVDVGVGETEYTAQLFAGDTSAALLAKLILFMVINLIGSNFLVFFRELTSARINRNMRRVLTDKVLRLPMSYFQDQNPRDGVNQIVGRAIVIDSTLTLFIIPLATAAYTGVRVIGKIFSYDWRLMVILLAFIPLQFGIAWLFGRINFSLSDTDNKLTTTLIRKLSEMITNIPLTKAFGKEDAQAQRGVEYVDRLYSLNIKSSWLDQIRDLSGSAISLAQSVLICVVGVVLLRDGTIAKRAWISFFLFSSLFTDVVTQFQMYWNNIKTIQGGADALTKIMDAEEEDPSGKPCEELCGDLRAENVSFGYTEDTPVLKNITCVFPDNAVTALMGVSGCGKTTLTHLLNRLYVPQGGVITAGGEPIGEFALHEYRSHFSVVSQGSLLFAGTIRDNLSYGNGETDDEKLYDALKKAGAYQFVTELPNGLDSPVEEYGGNLSGGQRQRLAVARALLSDDHYIIMDEPIASMDAIAAAELLQVIKRLGQDHCVIIITHTATVLPVADHVVVIEDGCVSAEGSVEEAAAASDFLKELMGKKVTL